MILKKVRSFIMPTAFPAIIIIQKNLEVSAHKYTGLQKNFSQKKLISEYIQKITNQKDQPK